MALCSKLDTVWFNVRNMDEALNFYRDVLGLNCTYSSPFWSSVQIGDGQIGLHGPEDPNLSEPSGGWVVSLLTDDIKALWQALANAKAEFEETLHDTPRGAVLSFKDPDGNRLQAMQLGLKAADFDGAFMKLQS